MRDVPGHIRSDNGPTDVAIAVRSRTAAVGARTACIKPGGPSNYGVRESCNSRPRDERLDGKISDGPAEAKVVIESWRLHSAPGYRPPAPKVVRWPTLPPRATPPATPAVAPRPDMHQDRTRTTRWGRPLQKIVFQVVGIEH